eukprot:4911831-Amphidinium_carterae.1
MFGASAPQRTSNPQQIEQGREPRRFVNCAYWSCMPHERVSQDLSFLSPRTLNLFRRSFLESSDLQKTQAIQQDKASCRVASLSCLLSTKQSLFVLYQVEKIADRLQRIWLSVPLESIGGNFPHCTK